MGVLLAVSTLLAAMPRATESHETASAVSASRPVAASHSTGPVVGTEPDQDRDDHHDGDRQPRLDHAAQDVAGEDRDAGDVHRPEPGDDALVHVHGDRDRGALGGADHGHQQDPRDHVGDVRGAAPGDLPEAGAERAAEDVHEQQQQHDRQARRRTWSATGSGASGAGCVAASSPSRRRRGGMRSSDGHLLVMGVAGERQEDIVEVRGLEREGVDVDRSRRRACPGGPAASAPRRRRGPGASATRRRAPPPRTPVAARSSSAASPNESRMWPPGASRFSSSGVPSATSTPRSRTPIRSASRSASSRYCVVRKIVTPPATSSWIVCHMPRRLRGSSPAVGSSRKMTRGSPTSVMARSRRRRMPPEYVDTGLPGRLDEVEPLEQLGDAPAAHAACPGGGDPPSAGGSPRP